MLSRLIYRISWLSPLSFFDIFLMCNTGMDIRVAVVEYQYIIYILFGMRIFRYSATGVGGRSVSISNVFNLRVEISR